MWETNLGIINFECSTYHKITEDDYQCINKKLKTNVFQLSITYLFHLNINKRAITNASFYTICNIPTRTQFGNIGKHFGRSQSNLGSSWICYLALVWQQKHKSYVAMSSYSNGFIQNMVNGIWAKFNMCYIFLLGVARYILVRLQPRI